MDEKTRHENKKVAESLLESVDEYILVAVDSDGNVYTVICGKTLEQAINMQIAAMHNMIEKAELTEEEAIEYCTAVTNAALDLAFPTDPSPTNRLH